MAAPKLTLGDISARLERLEELLVHFNPVSDPAPDDWGRPIGRWGGLVGWRPPRPGDPSPIDLGRLSRVQLELTLHELAAERVRLDALEGMVKTQLSAKG